MESTNVVTNTNSSSMKLPKSWYMLGSASEVKIGQLREFELAGKTLLAHRIDDGTLVVTDSRCPHLGARLVHGKISKQQLVCPFHAWSFDQKGKCTHVPAAPCSKGRNLRTYAVTEKWGRIFVATTPKAAFDFPTFPENSCEDFVAGGDFTIKVDATWDAVAANGFDVVHLKFVHGRSPIEPSKIERTSESSLSITHDYEVDKTSLMMDRFIRAFTDGRCQMRYEVYGGNLIYVTTRLKNITNNLVISITPNEDGGCTVKLTCLRKKGFLPLTKLKLWVQGKISKAFFSREAKELGDAHFNPKALHESDVELKKFYSWLGELCPQN